MRVNAREKMAPTGFDNVALPHALNMSEKKTGIVFLLNDHPVDWGNNDQCQLVIMVSVNKSDTKIFGVVLQTLIEVLSVRSNVQRILEIQSFDELIPELSNMIYKANKLDF